MSHNDGLFPGPKVHDGKLYDPSLFGLDDARLRTEIKAQIAWIEKCGGELRTYCVKYGFDRGHSIFVADMNRLESMLAEFRRRGCPSAPRGGDHLDPL